MKWDEILETQSIRQYIADIKDSPEYWGEMARLDFAQLLNDEMHKQKMSQKQLAAKLGVSVQYIHKVLSGNSTCSLSQMAKLMFALGRRIKLTSAPITRSLKLDKELFFELCQKYGVQFSQDCDCLMLEDEDGSIREFTDADIDRIFAADVVKK